MVQFVAPRPGQIGNLAVLIDAIPASRADISRHLGITPRTLAHWEATESAPRAVMVAAFAESGYGRNMVTVTYRNEADQYRALSDCQRRDIATLQARIARLEALGDYGAANLPYQSALTGAASHPFGLQVIADLGGLGQQPRNQQAGGDQ